MQDLFQPASVKACVLINDILLLSTRDGRINLFEIFSNRDSYFPEPFRYDRVLRLNLIFPKEQKIPCAQMREREKRNIAQ